MYNKHINKLTKYFTIFINTIIVYSVIYNPISNDDHTDIEEKLINNNPTDMTSNTIPLTDSKNDTLPSHNKILYVLIGCLSVIIMGLIAGLIHEKNQCKLLNAKLLESQLSLQNGKSQQILIDDITKENKTLMDEKTRLLEQIKILISKLEEKTNEHNRLKFESEGNKAIIDALTSNPGMLYYYDQNTNEIIPSCKNVNDINDNNYEYEYYYEDEDAVPTSTTQPGIKQGQN